MAVWAFPSEANDFLADHASMLLHSYTHWTGRALLPPDLAPVDQARALFQAPFVLVSHNAAAAPIFTYGNQTALALFEMTWAEFTALPSRQSAEPMHQDERAHFLATVAEHGYIAGYQGVRASKTGRRFLIQDVTVWNLIDRAGQYCGQAASYRDWTFLD